MAIIFSIFLLIKKHCIDFYKNTVKLISHQQLINGGKPN